MLQQLKFVELILVGVNVGFLSEISLSTASSSLYSSIPADWVEQCDCPEGHVGQFCESCAPGYRRAVKIGGPLTKCIKCDCHGHSDSCDAESGACICQHHTSGDSCETCARGYYGNALNGTETDCQKCDCPDGGPCLPLPEGGMACSECPIGHAGIKCEFCASEFYGNPLLGQSCLPCPCNDNIDFNSIGNCDSRSGECRKCIYNTIGFNCEQCKTGFWGNATAELRNECQECNCFSPGTKKGGYKDNNDFDNLRCHSLTGQCECWPHVIGRSCDSCEKGFYNITSGIGCQQCECDPIGSENGFCDSVTGKCKCKPGVTGLKCDQCAREYYGFNFEGCQPCQCNSIGSELRDCDVNSGQCYCRDNVEGRRCDQCSENRFNMRAGCLPCDDCYKLIQTQKNQIVKDMEQIEDGLNYWESHPITINDEKITALIKEERQKVEQFNNKFKGALDSRTIRELKQFKQLIPRASKLLSNLSNHTYFNSIDETADELEIGLKDFQTIRANLTTYLNTEIHRIQKEGNEKLEAAKENVKKYGNFDPNISEMAKDAIKVSRKNTVARDEIKRLSEKIWKNVIQAKQEAEEAIRGENASRKIQDLEKMANQTAALLKKTKAFAAQPVADAEKLFNEVNSLEGQNRQKQNILNKIIQQKNKTESAIKELDAQVSEAKNVLQNIEGMLFQC
uniref:Laminin EGF-like domain-containing protein n=1 Tax=Panagrolaimus superbus TaxID=310955 RepID=A0A914Z8T6_9BILA